MGSYAEGGFGGPGLFQTLPVSARFDYRPPDLFQAAAAYLRARYGAPTMYRRPYLGSAARLVLGTLRGHTGIWFPVPLLLRLLAERFDAEAVALGQAEREIRQLRVHLEERFFDGERQLRLP